MVLCKKTKLLFGCQLKLSSVSSSRCLKNRKPGHEKNSSNTSTKDSRRSRSFRWDDKVAPSNECQFFSCRLERQNRIEKASTQRADEKGISPLIANDGSNVTTACNVADSRPADIV